MEIEIKGERKRRAGLTHESGEPDEGRLGGNFKLKFKFTATGTGSGTGS